MRIDISTPDEVQVTISDKDGYSPDKLDDWIARATQFVTTERQIRLHMVAMEVEMFGKLDPAEPDVPAELSEGDTKE